MFTVERAGSWAVVSWEPDEASTEDVVMAFTEEAYARSKAIGMGAMHFREGPLPEETREEILAGYRKAGSVNLDYVHGRCCKFCLEEDLASKKMRRVRIAEDHWSRDHPGVSIEDLAAGVEELLADEAADDEPQSIEAMLEQAIVTVAKGGSHISDEGGFVAVNLPSHLTPAEAENAEEVFGGDLCHVEGAVVNVAALRDREDEVRALAEEGDAKAVLAVAALEKDERASE